jgi:putative phosphoribosyl transferase
MFTDRREAGRSLARSLATYRGTDAVVLALPRGGVPVGLEVARRLHLPLDVIVVRKLGVPSQPELAAGAIGESGVRVLNDPVVRMAGLSGPQLARLEAAARTELEDRVQRFRGGRDPVSLSGRTAIIVDDGLATGATAAAACHVARALGAARVVLAVPVATPDGLEKLRHVADSVVCLEAPGWMSAVGQAYRRFEQVEDDEVARLLRVGRTWRRGVLRRRPVAAGASAPRAPRG